MNFFDPLDDPGQIPDQAPFPFSPAAEARDNPKSVWLRALPNLKVGCRA